MPMWILLRSVWLLSLLLGAPSLASAAEFTMAQRAEIIAIVRDALKNDPSILRDAVTSLQADEGEHARAASHAAIADARDSLVRPERPGGRQRQR